MKFVVDHNVGKLVKWLRMLGYDTLFFAGEDDWQMLTIALNEGRVVLTRDTGIMSRGVVAGDRVKAVLIQSDIPDEQIRQVVRVLGLDIRSGLFSRCLECNHPLEHATRDAVAGRVPPYVFKTQDMYLECPACHRIYWKGTHWQAMTAKLAKISS